MTFIFIWKMHIKISATGFLIFCVLSASNLGSNSTGRSYSTLRHAECCQNLAPLSTRTASLVPGKLGSTFLSQQHNTGTGTEQPRAADYCWEKKTPKLGGLQGRKNVEAFFWWCLLSSRLHPARGIHKLNLFLDKPRYFHPEDLRLAQEPAEAF